MRVVVKPLKTYPPLVVYSYTELPLTVAVKRLKSVARQTHEGFERICGIKNPKSFFRLPPESAESFYLRTLVQLPGIFILEAFNHNIVIPFVLVT